MIRRFVALLAVPLLAAPLLGAAAPAAVPSLTNVRHVVVIMLENRRWVDVGLGFSSMPYMRSVGGKYFRNWVETDKAEGSLTQYIGLTSGLANPGGIRQNCAPSATCSTTANNIFRQVRVSGGTARSYVEGAPGGCAPTSMSPLGPLVVPALYYWDAQDRAACMTEVRPLQEFDPEHPPTFAMISPDLCNSGHDCQNATVDLWMSQHLPAILNSLPYRNGQVLVNVLYDEDYPVPNLHLHPSIRSGPAAGKATHARMLATWEFFLGLPRLVTATTLRGAYRK
jgi:hypothetical protein